MAGGKLGQFFSLILLMQTLIAAGCGDKDFTASAVIGGGPLMINEEQNSSLVINLITWNTIGNTTTVSLSGSYFNPLTQMLENPLIILILPANVVNVPIDLENSGSTFSDANFVSSSVSGEIALDGIEPGSISGSIDAAFEDANGDIRELSDVHFQI